MKYYTVENNKKSIFKTFAIYYICMAVFCVIRILATLGYMPEAKLGDVVFTLIIQVIVMFLLPFVLYCLLIKVRPRALFKTCNFDKVNFTVILLSFGLGILCFFINIAVSSLFNGILTFTGYRFGSSGGSADYSTANFFLDLFLVAVLPGFCEEFLHRGIVLQGIKHFGFKKAIVISSLLFGLLHFNIQQAMYAFVIGLILGFVSVVAKNIWPAIIIHFTNNAISTYIDYASNRGWLFGDILTNLQNSLVSTQAIWIFIASAVIMIIVVVLLIWFIWLLYKQSIVRKVNKAIDKIYLDDSEAISDDSHIVINKRETIKDLLEKNTLLNLTVEKMDNPIDIVMPKEKSRYKETLKDKLFMWGAIVLGGAVTLFTYIWGLI